MPPSDTRCPSCDALVLQPSKFCGQCGKRLEGAPSRTPRESASATRTRFMHALDPTLPKELSCRLVHIDEEGGEGMTYTLRTGESLCGRNQGHILIYDDPYVSPLHCEFSFHGGALAVTDQQSLNGVYVRLQKERALVEGDLLRVGRQLLRFDEFAPTQAAPPGDEEPWGSPAMAAFGRISQVWDDGRAAESRLMVGESFDVGRDQGSLVFPTDAFVSGRHCTFFPRGDRVLVKDLGSANGTFLRARGRTTLVHGDLVLIGQQLLRVEIQ